MELSPKQEKENEEQIKKQFQELKKYFKQYSKNDLCRLAAVNAIEIADFRECLKQYYEKYGPLEDTKQESKND